MRSGLFRPACSTGGSACLVRMDARYRVRYRDSLMPSRRVFQVLDTGFSRFCQKTSHRSHPLRPPRALWRDGLFCPVQLAGGVACLARTDFGSEDPSGSAGFFARRTHLLPGLMPSRRVFRCRPPNFTFCQKTSSRSHPLRPPRAHWRYGLFYPVQLAGGVALPGADGFRLGGPIR